MIITELVKWNIVDTELKPLMSKGLQWGARKVFTSDYSDSVKKVAAALSVLIKVLLNVSLFAITATAMGNITSHPLLLFGVVGSLTVYQNLSVSDKLVIDGKLNISKIKSSFEEFCSNLESLIRSR